MMFSRRQRRERDLDEEIQAHLRLAEADGHSPESARRDFGNVTLVKEQAREIWGRTWMDSLLQDARYAVRTLSRTPGFTITAILVLTLAIGANTAMFSLISTLLLRPLNAPEPDRIVVFSNVKADENDAASPAKFNVWREQKDLFDDVAAWQDEGMANLTGVDTAEQVRETRASAGYFRLFGAEFALGRAFSENEDSPGSGTFVILSATFWKTRLGGNPHVQGKTIVLNGVPHRIVGVLAAAFRPLLYPAPEVYVPFQIEPNSDDQGDSMLVAGRLKPGVTIETARTKLRAIGEVFRKEHPGALDFDEGFGLKRLRDEMYGDVAPALLLFQGIVGFVLLIACANNANLLLIRACTRKREMSIRTAIGAGRGRIVRQLLTESVMLSSAGSIAGLIVGAPAMRALLHSNQYVMQWLSHYGPTAAVDWRVVGFTIAIAAATGVLFGILPALQISRSGKSPDQGRIRSLLTIGEMALALALLIGSGLLIHSLAELHKVRPGFDPHNVAVLHMSLAGPHFEKTEALAELARESARRFGAIPGVSASSMTACLPMDCTIDLPLIVAGRPLAGASHGDVYWTAISPGYFDVLRIPLLRGRVFTDRDEGAATGVVIINQAMARKYWPDGNPIGERVTLGKGLGPQYEEPRRQIVGVVGDIRSEGLDEVPKPAVYIPVAQLSKNFAAKLVQAGSLTWVVRARVDPKSMLVPMVNALRAAGGGLPVGDVRSMDEFVAGSISAYAFSALLLTIFGASALLLAAIGIYGVMAYSVQLRTKEIGIRLALGAEARVVRNRVVMEAMRLAVAGAAIGMVAGAGLSRLLADELYGVKPLDPAAFVGAPVLLCAVALLAAWFPARRAGRIDPMDAIRDE